MWVVFSVLLSHTAREHCTHLVVPQLSSRLSLAPSTSTHIIGSLIQFCSRECWGWWGTKMDQKPQWAWKQHLAAKAQSFSDVRSCWISWKQKTIDRPTVVGWIICRQEKKLTRRTVSMSRFTVNVTETKRSLASATDRFTVCRNNEHTTQSALADFAVPWHDERWKSEILPFSARVNQSKSSRFALIHPSAFSAMLPAPASARPQCQLGLDFGDVGLV